MAGLSVQARMQPAPQTVPLSKPPRNPKLVVAEQVPNALAVNPLEYRVQHQPSGLNSHWLPLPRSVLLLLELSDASFAAAPLVSCPQGLRLSLRSSTGDQLDGRVRWVEGRVFRARLPGKGCASARP